VTETARDNAAYRFPVSVKGVVVRGDRVILLHNSRGEWELPGGKLELDESPERCVTREIEEELGLSVEPRALLDTWVYAISPDVHVLIVTFGCVEHEERDAVLSDEHARLRWLPLDALESVAMPEGYRASIRLWAGRKRGEARA
jgi:8-oxo-dGTP pyrophosphatase MutT (NUDIX family)